MHETGNAGAAPHGRRRRRAVVSLRDVRPIWQLPSWAREGIASSFPADWDVRFSESPVDGRGDGSGVSEELLAIVPGAEVYIGFGAPRSLFVAATQAPDVALRWIHTATAGVSALLYPELVESDVILTNSAGAHAPAIAETVLAMMLHFARGLDFAMRGQFAKQWAAEPFETRIGAVAEIEGATLGIVGFGGIGHAVAHRARALGMTVIATRRSARAAPPDVELLTGRDALERLLRRSDYVVVTVPATAATRGMIGAEQIATMKPGAVLVNVSRGELIDEHALLRALASGALRGAALDVFATEPIPPDSPLWTTPNLLITPHVSATTPRFWVRQVELIRDNIARYLAGRGLRNVVDKTRGY